jgi:hypothetical protein
LLLLKNWGRGENPALIFKILKEDIIMATGTFCMDVGADAPRPPRKKATSFGEHKYFWEQILERCATTAERTNTGLARSGSGPRPEDHI